jgi:hypothetical protein
MPTPHDPATDTKPDPGLSDNLVIVLAGPSHDDLTEYTSGLVRDLSDLGHASVLRIFNSPLTYERLLNEEAIDPRTTDVALIFCGHGEDHSLRGPGAEPGAPGCRTLKSSFYDDSQYGLRPKFMLAFCCYAANGLGKTYEDKTTGHTFIGFDDKIGFVMEDGWYVEWWEKILHGIASAMLTATDVYELERAARDIYKEALWAFRSDEDGENDWGLTMRFYLRRQFRAINFIQT